MQCARVFMSCISSTGQMVQMWPRVSTWVSLTPVWRQTQKGLNSTESHEGQSNLEVGGSSSASCSGAHIPPPTWSWCSVGLSRCECTCFEWVLAVWLMSTALVLNAWSTLLALSRQVLFLRTKVRAPVFITNVVCLSRMTPEVVALVLPWCL